MIHGKAPPFRLVNLGRSLRDRRETRVRETPEEREFQTVRNIFPSHSRLMMQRSMMKQRGKRSGGRNTLLSPYGPTSRARSV